MSDIFEIAKKYNYADYYDPRTGYIYHISDWYKAKSNGILTHGIDVEEAGVIIGFVRDPDCNDYDINYYNQDEDNNHYSSFRAACKNQLNGTFECKDSDLKFSIYEFKPEDHNVKIRFFNIENLDSCKDLIDYANEKGEIPVAWLEDIVGTYSGCCLRG